MSVFSTPLKLIYVDWVEMFSRHNIEAEDSLWASNLFDLKGDTLYLSYNRPTAWLYSSNETKPGVMLSSEITLPHDEWRVMRRFNCGCIYFIDKEDSHTVVNYLLAKSL